MGGGGRGGLGGGMRQGGPGRAPVELKEIKRDKIDKPVEEMFRAADLNGDGMVTIEELHATLTNRRAALIGQRFKAIDGNGDKVIDELEFIAWQESLGSLASSDVSAGGIDLGPVPDTISPALGKGAEDNALRLVIEPLGATVLINANSNYDQGMTLPELLAYERTRGSTQPTPTMTARCRSKNCVASIPMGVHGRTRLARRPRDRIPQPDPHCRCELPAQLSQRSAGRRS